MRFAVTAVLALAAAVCAQSSGSASSASASASSVSASKSSASASKSSAISAGQSSGSAAASAAEASASAVLTPCVLGCLTAAANATECGSPANLTCACTNADFQFKSSSCLQAECLASELGAAVGLQKQQCGALALSATAAPSATAPFTPSNPAADISGAPSSAGSSNSPSSTPGSAMSLFAANGATGLMLAMGVAVVGGVAGAVFV
ncbi:hypothetical protein DFH08DRAFT_874191 [Mycena albidolilacea]|uniref:CFEM domain-containing protein n=1 Tax=Mycena albidolilacea TaxID=1033008 RepID=A0AAD6ZVG5_9AGAR|nr:hypothetical protein DFH08DRAFT_874191 [Mycena albidolilacea]